MKLICKTGTNRTTYQYVITFLWSLFEAVFFFIVADVPLSLISIESLKKAFKALGYALLGALLGGIIMYTLGFHNSSNLANYLKLLPDVRPEYLLEVKNGLQNNGLITMFNGPVKGIPYKVYALYSGELELSFTLFILLSIPGRAARFIISILVSNFVSKIILKKVSLRRKQLVVLSFWILYYTFHFNKL